MGRAPDILRSAWARLRPRNRVRPEDAIHSWKIIRGDMVQVCEGRDKGMRGVVAKVMRQTNQVVVEGVNLVRLGKKRG